MITYKNPICSGADPWLFSSGGYYYLVCTAGRQLKIKRGKTPVDISADGGKPIFTPPENTEYSSNLWSPEIHYFSREEFGDDFGWYMFVACDNGENINHRMYVLKSENGQPDGQYVNPVDGIANKPQKLASDSDDSVNNSWGCGQTILRHNGSVYVMWVNEYGRGTEDFHQSIMCAKLKKPWIITGGANSICLPTEEWEMHGAGRSANSDKIFPKVVEGGTAVYGDDGNTYVVYSGSGYWTPYYALGVMVLRGDNPTDINSWEKNKTPIFSMSDSVFGCGHASYIKSPDGKHRYICYHAYLNRDRTGGRFVFLEEYKIENEKFIIGDGSGKPAPLDREQYFCD